MARRYEETLSEEIAELDEHLDRLVAQVAPELVALPGIGTDSAATLLIVAGDNPQRLGSEASFARLCQPVRGLTHRSLLRQGGEAPPQGSGGNREANPVRCT